MSARRERGRSLLWRATRNFFADGCLDHAAAVAYYAILSLAPSFYLLGLLLGRVLHEGDARNAALSRIAAFFPGEATPVLQRLGASLPMHEGAAVLALPALIWVATTAFTTLEKAVNVAFGTHAGRVYWLSKLKSFLVASAVTLLLVASMVVNHGLDALRRYRQSLGLPQILGAGTAWVSYLVLLLMAFATFTTFYKILPGTRVRWSCALRSGFLALVFWEAARRVFGSLIVHSPAFGLLTGTIAGVVGLLLWIYTAVAICLIGAEIAALLNGSRPAPVR